MSLGLFLVTIVMGLTIGDLYANPPLESTIQWRGIHMLTGTSAALAVLFVLSIAITYFVGTSRWCKEVTETYKIDPQPLLQSTHLKRRTFPWCVAGMLCMVGVAALGAASDPGTGGKETAEWATIHLGGSFLGLAFVAWTYFRVWLNIVANQSVIKQILEAVAVIRRERGLDAESEPAAAAATASSEQM